MEEQNKQSEQETSGAEPKEQGTPTRSSIIMLLAGVYLLYTGYKLCKDVLDGVNGILCSGSRISDRRNCYAGGWRQRPDEEGQGEACSRSRSAGADPETAGTCRREEIYEYRTESTSGRRT